MKQILIAACLALTLAPAALAATWTFDNVSVTRIGSGGSPLAPPATETGTISGSFDYNALTNVYSNSSVTLSLTGGVSPLILTFNAPAPINDPLLALSDPVTFAPADASRVYFQGQPIPNSPFTPVLSLVFAVPLTETGGTVGLTAWRQDSCDTASCSFINALSTSGFSISGSVIAPSPPPAPVPLPAGLPLLLAGLSGIAMLGRARRRA